MSTTTVRKNLLHALTQLEECSANSVSNVRRLGYTIGEIKRAIRAGDVRESGIGRIEVVRPWR